MTNVFTGGSRSYTGSPRRLRRATRNAKADGSDMARDCRQLIQVLGNLGRRCRGICRNSLDVAMFPRFCDDSTAIAYYIKKA